MVKRQACQGFPNSCIQSATAADHTLLYVPFYYNAAARERQWTLRYVVLKYLYEETVPC